MAEAQAKVAPLIQAPYRTEWSGEFRQMEQAERRMLLIVGLSLALIFLLLYLAFRSLLDALVIFANVVAMSLGGVWALLLTGTNFNISAAVGFISILGRGGHERPAVGLVVQRACGPRACRCARRSIQGRRAADPAGDDHRPGGDPRAAARRPSRPGWARRPSGRWPSSWSAA